jgi:hypothetical protein
METAERVINLIAQLLSKGKENVYYELKSARSCTHRQRLGEILGNFIANCGEAK